eukprot:5735144-Prymnesium_polylepis.1
MTQVGRTSDGGAGGSSLAPSATAQKLCRIAHYGLLNPRTQRFTTLILLVARLGSPFPHRLTCSDCLHSIATSIHCFTASTAARRRASRAAQGRNLAPCSGGSSARAPSRRPRIGRP